MFEGYFAFCCQTDRAVWVSISLTDLITEVDVYNLFDLLLLLCVRQLCLTIAIHCNCKLRKIDWQRVQVSVIVVNVEFTSFVYRRKLNRAVHL